MDLVDTLRNKIQVLGDEECVPGLRAVLLHIETAFKHLSRGQKEGEDTAFTDSIYRTNQAFEGSIKEAYRVLAGKDPDHKKSYEIERYLEKENVFRPRVLSQLTTYRTEWRNPSAHDYKLNFDESEAFLAIVSVSAFSCLLLDQITERVAFIAAQAEAERELRAAIEAIEAAKQAGLLEWVTEIFARFLSHPADGSASAPAMRAAKLIGGVTGYMSTVSPELQVRAREHIGKMEVDLIVAQGQDEVVVEFMTRYDPQRLRIGARYLQSVMQRHDDRSRKGLIIMSLGGVTKPLRMESPFQGAEIMALVPADARVPEGFLATP